MKKVFVYGVVIVTGSNYKEVFRNENKQICKDWKKENRTLGKLAVVVLDTKII